MGRGLSVNRSSQSHNLLSETRTNVQYPAEKLEKQGKHTKVETREGRVRLLSDVNTGVFKLEIIFSQTTRRKEVTFERNISGEELQGIMEWGKLADKQPTEQYVWLMGLVYIRHTDVEANGPGEQSCIGLKGYDHSVAIKQAAQTLKDEKMNSEFKAAFTSYRDPASSSSDQEPTHEDKMQEDLKMTQVRLACARQQMDEEAGLALWDWYGREQCAESSENASFLTKICRASGRAEIEDELSSCRGVGGFLQFVDWLCSKFQNVRAMSAYDVRRFAELIEAENSKVNRR